MNETNNQNKEPDKPEQPEPQKRNFQLRDSFQNEVVMEIPFSRTFWTPVTLTFMSTVILICMVTLIFILSDMSIREYTFFNMTFFGIFLCFTTFMYIREVVKKKQFSKIVLQTWMENHPDIDFDGDISLTNEQVEDIIKNDESISE